MHAFAVVARQEATRGVDLPVAEGELPLIGVVCHAAMLGGKLIGVASRREKRSAFARLLCGWAPTTVDVPKGTFGGCHKGAQTGAVGHCPALVVGPGLAERNLTVT
jgi:hypothetical protein